MARVASIRREQVYERQSKYRQQRSVRIQGGALLKDAAIHNNIGELSELLEQRKARGITREEMNQALMLCCRYGNTDCAKRLLDYEAYMDYQDDDLWTPLHFAAAHGHKTIVQLLFKYNVDTAILDVDGRFAIDYAKEDDIRCLIADQMARHGLYEKDLPSIRSRLMKAMTASVHANISRRKDLTVTNKNGVTPIHTAAVFGYYEIVQSLIESGGVPVDIVDDHGQTPLYVALKYKQINVANYLVSKGANMEVLDPSLSQRLSGDYSIHSQSLSNSWKLSLLAKEDGLREGKWLREHNYFYTLSNTTKVDEPMSRGVVPTSRGDVSSSFNTVEMIYDDCLEVRSQLNSEAPNNTPADIEDMYDTSVNVLRSFVSTSNHSKTDDYDDVVIATGSSSQVSTNGHTYSDSTENLYDDCINYKVQVGGASGSNNAPQPYEVFVRQQPPHKKGIQLQHEVTTSTRSNKLSQRRRKLSSSVDKISPTVPPKPHNKLNKSRSADVQPLPLIPGSWQAHVVPATKSSPLTRRDSTPSNAPPPPPHRKVSLNKQPTQSTPPPLPSRPRKPMVPPTQRLSPKPSHQGLPSYDAILECPELFPLSPTSSLSSAYSSESSTTQSPSPISPTPRQQPHQQEHTRLKKSVSVEVVSSNLQYNGARKLSHDSHMNCHTPSEERVKVPPPKPLGFISQFQ